MPWNKISNTHRLLPFWPCSSADRAMEFFSIHCLFFLRTHPCHPDSDKGSDRDFATTTQNVSTTSSPSQWFFLGLDWIVVIIINPLFLAWTLRLSCKSQLPLVDYFVHFLPLDFSATHLRTCVQLATLLSGGINLTFWPCQPSSVWRSCRTACVLPIESCSRKDSKTLKSQILGATVVGKTLGMTTLRYVLVLPFCSSIYH